MRPTTIPATEAARNFSDILNRVRYQSASFEVTRGREVVARIVPPAAAANGLPLARLTELMSRLAPILDTGERRRFAADVAASRKRLKAPDRKWD